MKNHALKTYIESNYTGEIKEIAADSAVVIFPNGKARAIRLDDSGRAHHIVLASEREKQNLINALTFSPVIGGLCAE